MSEPENPGATTASSTPTTETAEAPAPPAGKDVPTQLAELRELVVEHAAAMGQLHDMTSQEVEAVSKDVVQLRSDVGQKLDPLSARLDAFEARFNDAMVRLGVDRAPAPSTAPAKPAKPLVWDGAGWVPGPDEPTEEPTS